MKRLLFLAVIVAQVGLLAYMAGEREWISRHGHALLLRTAPVDPRDPMRGDYVRFDYEIAHIPKSLCQGAVKSWLTEKPQPSRSPDFRDRVVFASVRIDDAGVAEVTGVSDERPKSGVFLRGRAVRVSGQTLDVRFGVEALFTQQGKARDFEKEAAAKPGVPVDVEVAVSDGGTAVLKGYRWEPLGITVEVDRPPRQQAQPGARAVPQPRLEGATVELTNHGTTPIAIVVRPDGTSFRLLGNERWQENHFEWVGLGRALPAPETAMVRVLAPGGTYREHLDFNRPEWFVRDNRKPGEAPKALGMVSGDWDTTFRIEYAPPTRAESTALSSAAPISYSRIRSRAFGAVGID